MAGNAYPKDLQHIAPLQHYPYLSGYVQQVRAEAAEKGGQVLLIDSGDSLTGSFASHVTGSENMVLLFNQLGYDALFLGNLDAGIDADLLQKLDMPVLGPFLNREGAPALPEAPPVQMVEKDNRTYRLAANFYGTIPVSRHPQRFPMWFGSENRPVQAVRDYQPWIGDESVAFTLLNWMKFESDARPAPEESALIRTVQADAITAHKVYSPGGRETWEEKTYPEWPVPLAQNILRLNRGFTVVRMDLERRGDQWKAIRPPRLIQLTANTAPPDPGIIDALAPLSSAISIADEELGLLETSLDQARFLDAYLAILQTYTPEADAIVSSINSVRDTLEAGPLKASRLFNALPWTNDLELLTLSPEQFQQVLSIPELSLLHRQDLPDEITLATSRFFARLILRELELDPQTAQPMGTPGEFDALVSFLKKNGIQSLQTPEREEGWIRMDTQP